MTLPIKLPLILSLIAMLFSAAPGALAGTTGIKDHADFFSANAESDATYNIRELQKTLKKDLLIETFAEIPADVRQGVNANDKAAMSRLYDTWAVKRAKEESVNGVYVLLVKQPAHLQAVVGNDTQKQAFTLADRDALVQRMLGKLRAKDFDGALREGVAFVTSTMGRHAGSAGQSPPATATHQEAQAVKPASPFGGLVPILIIGVLAWLAFAFIRALVRSGSGGGNMVPGTPGMGGGGGFGRSMLGGLFGAAAGMWLYDNFFGSHGSSAYGAPPPSNDPLGGSGGGTGDSPFSGQDTDYSSSGGDFGGGSGSDFGGGGDSGGGGGDF